MIPRRFGVKPELARIEEQVQRLINPLESEIARPLPTPNHPLPYRLHLSDITSDPTDKLSFHVIGDSGGIVDSAPQAAVAARMDAFANDVSFCYHVGDVVYFTGDRDKYFPQFYEPYEKYNRPIFAIPGNHDGYLSLDSFVDNFCATSPHLTPESMDSERDAMTQPYVHWTLNCALVTIIGLYSNVPSGGLILADQEDWFVKELAEADPDKPLIVALHHPPYSADAMHGGSKRMGDLLDKCFYQANRIPDVVLSGHVHNYQRFTRTSGLRKKVIYIVQGASGYHNLHNMANDALAGKQIGDVMLENFIVEHGFLTLTIDSAKKLSGVYRGSKTSDQFEVQL